MMSSNQQAVNQGQLVNEVPELAQLKYEIDYNNAALVIISTGLGQVPAVGFVLSALVEIFWPSSQQDVWAEIESKVEQLVDQKISDLVYKQVEESLMGLHNNLNEYLWAVQHTQDKNLITQKFNIAHGHFIQELPHFQSKGYELLLLPLFTQFANLHLSLLRDGVLYGADWGWSEDIQRHQHEQITTTIEQYTTYTDEIYTNALNDTKSKAPSNKHFTEPFNTINRFTREMTLTVLDFKTLWSYYDPTLYPDPVQIYLDREIYSDAIGTADDSGPIHLPSPPTTPITKIEVWSGTRIDACQVTYEQGGGPDGVTQTPRMGNKDGGAANVFDLTTLGPVTGVKTQSGTILDAWWFTFSDGSTSIRLGGDSGSYKNYFSYPDEILSSIKIMGVSNYFKTADCAVFGFKFNQASTIPESAVLRTMYVASPAKMSPQELARYVGAEDVDKLGACIQEWSELYQWDAMRQARWEKIGMTIELSQP
ncbi:insecticidal delta-endotoxin Cry8Ea1 family protein [Paenibacillus septentrionalis]|uniref:Insecticidal delta-endotoxin Cry8Ea1 family protein n=1 Tax=Paenibacillus septentrionalis TaxID=429342 RepID=A0ABW1V9Y5_9BACL